MWRRHNTETFKGGQRTWGCLAQFLCGLIALGGGCRIEGLVDQQGQLDGQQHHRNLHFASPPSDLFNPTVYPNPFTHFFTYAFRLQEEAVVSIQVVAPNGSKPGFMLKDQHLQKGSHQITWNSYINGQFVPSSFYVLLLQSMASSSRKCRCPIWKSWLPTKSPAECGAFRWAPEGACVIAHFCSRAVPALPRFLGFQQEGRQTLLSSRHNEQSCGFLQPH